MRRPAALLLLALLAGPALAQDLVSFRTPSGNIHCLGGPGFVDCEVIATTALPPLPRHADCQGEWGHRFGLDAAGGAYMICAGDTVRDPAAPVLGYGRSVDLGGIVCRSQESGLTCGNAGGHGFRLSRGGQELR